MQRGIRDKSGRVREVLYTPITATGEVMSQKDIDAYIDGLDGSDDILAADKAGKGMIIHIDANPNGNDGQDLHLMQEAYGRGPQASAEGKSEPVAQPGQVITPQQAKDVVDKVTHDIQQRADARKQEELARNRHQNSADPMNRLFNPVNPQQPQQSSGTVNQPGVDQVPQVTNLAGLAEALERTKKAVDEATESEEDKKAREKREKRQALMAKIGDGLGAFHEAYSHMMGTKPMTSGSLSAAQEARVRALGLQRDQEYKNALDNYLKVLEMQRKEDYYNSIAETRRAQQESLDRDRAEKRSMQQEKNNAYIKLMEAKRQNELEKSDYYTAYLAALNSGADKETAETYANQEVVRLANEREAQEQAVAKAKENSYNAQANQRNAAANASNARADKTRAGGSAGGGATTTTQTKVVYDRNGNVKGRTETTTTKKKGGGSGGSSRGRGNGNGNNNNSGKKKTGVNWNK